MPEQILSLSKKQADDIAAVCELGFDTLNKIAAAVEAMPLTIKKKKIQETIAAQFGAEKAGALERVLFGLAAVHRRNFDDASSLLDAVVPPSWDKAQRVMWQECRPALERLLSAESIILAAKAIDLSFDVEQFCIGVRIITDIRPIFDQKRNKIAGSTIRQTLRLDYTGVDGSVTSVSIGLDADDIARIQKSCEEATHKVSVARDALNRAGLTEIIIPGEEDDE